MKFFIVLSAVAAVAFAKPHVALAPLAYAHLVPGAPTGPDGRVVDTPEVAYAKAEHAAAHINEKITLANEAAKSYGAYSAPTVVAAYSAPAVVSAYSAPAVVKAYSAPAVVSAYSTHAVGPVYAAGPAVVSAYSAPLAYVHGAPTGIDGRVVDSPAVAVAKAEHAAAHINEKITLAHEAVKSATADAVVVPAYSAPAVVSAYSAPAFVKAYPSPAVVSTYGAPTIVKSYSAPTVVSSYSAITHSAVPAVSVW